MNLYDYCLCSIMPLKSMLRKAVLCYVITVKRFWRILKEDNLVMNNIGKASILILLILAIVVAVSGCTGGQPTATATPTATAVPSATPTAKPIQNFTTLTSGELLIGTEVPYPPFEVYNTTTNDFEGFDIDLMKEIAKELNVKPVFKSMNFDPIITATQTNQLDAGISAFSITGDRQMRVSFSDPYFESQQTIAVRTSDNSINVVADLKGKKVGVQRGTTGALTAENITEINKDDIKYYDHIDEAFMALKKGEVDAIINDLPVSAQWVREYPGDYKFTGPKLGDKEYYGIITYKGNPELTAAINTALANIKADGRYDAIYNKWFPQ